MIWSSEALCTESYIPSRHNTPWNRRTRLRGGLDNCTLLGQGTPNDLKSYHVPHRRFLEHPNRSSIGTGNREKSSRFHRGVTFRPSGVHTSKPTPVHTRVTVDTIAYPYTHLSRHGPTLKHPPPDTSLPQRRLRLTPNPCGHFRVGNRDPFLPPRFSSVSWCRSLHKVSLGRVRSLLLLTRAVPRS